MMRERIAGVMNDEQSEYVLHLKSSWRSRVRKLLQGV